MSATLEGTIVSAESFDPIADIVVTATSLSLDGEWAAVSDSSGDYRFDTLPIGEYTLRFESAGDYRAYSRGNVSLLEDRTYRVDAEMLPTGGGAAPSDAASVR